MVVALIPAPADSGAIHEPNISVLFWAPIAEENAIHDGLTPYSNVGQYYHYQIRAKAMQI